MPSLKGMQNLFVKKKKERRKKKRKKRSISCSSINQSHIHPKKTGHLHYL